MDRAEYVSPDDKEALDALRQFAHLEGIIPALESAHAVAECIKRAPKMSATDVAIVNISGRGDKDIHLWPVFRRLFFASCAPCGALQNCT